METFEYQNNTHRDTSASRGVSEIDKLIEAVDELVTMRRRARLDALRSHLESEFEGIDQRQIRSTQSR